MRAKVDGSVTTSANGVRVTSAEVDGATLTVTFDSNLFNTAAVNTGVLVTELGVQSAGDVQGYTGALPAPGHGLVPHGDGRGRDGDADAPCAEPAGASRASG